MGLDILAFSHLRFRTRDTESWDGEDGAVQVGPIVDGFDLLDGLEPGLYDPTTDVHLWWHAEHGSYAIPPDEVAAITDRVAQLRAGTVKRECPGDLAVLADAAPVTEQTSFRAGSYSGYNWWREQLCRFALEVEPAAVWQDPARFDGKPFVELINFSDAEGCIGPQTSRKLAGDFATHATRRIEWAARHITDTDERAYFLDSYTDWQGAFELAACNGVLIFC